MLARSRSGMVVLLDVFAILVLLLASRIISPSIDIAVSADHEMAIESSVTLLQRDAFGDFRYLTRDGWQNVRGDESWLTDMITIDCDLRCLSYEEAGTSTEILIVGVLARNLLFDFYNFCRNEGGACRGRKYFVVNSDFNGNTSP